MIDYNEIEITAPVGSYESLIAAIQGGADSVYFGIDELNMRSRSSINFTLFDLERISSICNENNIKSYITLNTVMYDTDIPLMQKIIDAAKKNRIKAIIASDQAAINYANNKRVAVHISTQLSVSNVETVRFYSKFADVIVLARELSLSQIKHIIQAIDKEGIKGPSGKLMKIEVFIHGALCMAISGKCFLSLHMHNASANRGACYQVCRREYFVKDDTDQELVIQNKFIMSPKDLCTIGFIDQIVNSGIKILKIEGRSRSPEYVKTSVQAYKEAINSIKENSFSVDKVEKWKKGLSKVFNRGFWDGHFLGDTVSNWNTDIYGSKSTQRKVYLGKGIKYFKNIKVGEFIMESGSLKVNDKVIITGPTTGVLETEVRELRLNEKNVYEVNKGDNFSMPIDQIIRASDKLYKVETYSLVND